MPANTDEIARVQEFLDALTELSRRTGVVVWGCNCHDSPALLVDAEEFRGPWDADGWYVVDYNPDVEPDSPWSRRFGEVRWRPRADDAANEADLRLGLAEAPSLLPPAADPTANG